MVLVGRTICDEVPISGEFRKSWDKVQDKLDRMYFNNLPDHYPEATATITKGSMTVVVHRNAGSNAAGQWRRANDNKF